MLRYPASHQLEALFWGFSITEPVVIDELYLPHKSLRDAESRRHAAIIFRINSTQVCATSFANTANRADFAVLLQLVSNRRLSGNASRAISISRRNACPRLPLMALATAPRHRISSHPSMSSLYCARLINFLPV